MRKRSLTQWITIVCIVLLLTPPHFVFAQTADGKPLKKEALLKVLRQNLLTTRELVSRVEQRGVDFQLMPEDEAEFRRAGAQPALFDALRANYRGSVVAVSKPAPEVKPLAPSKPSASARVQPGALGVMSVTLTPQMSQQIGLNGMTGAWVRLVVPNGPAAHANLLPNDLITQFNGRPVVTEALRDLVTRTPAGTTVYLTVLRQNRVESVPVVLSAASADTAFTYDDLTDQSFAAIQNKDWLLAGDLLTHAIQMNPNLPLAYGLLGYTLLYGRGDLYNAEQAMRAAIERGGSAAFEVWHAQGPAFDEEAAHGSLFISKNRITFKSSLSADEFSVNDTELRKAGVNSIFGRERNAFHLEVRLPTGKTRNYNFTPRTGSQMESLLILNLIRSY
jgi:hypothetical protein